MSAEYLTLPTDTLEIIIPFCDDFRNFYYLEKVGRVKKIVIDTLNGLPESQWDYMMINYEVSEDLMREFWPKLNPVSISVYQTLSENFMREFNDDIINRYNSTRLCAYQKLSENFMREFKEVLYLPAVILFQDYSKEFEAELKSYIWYSNVKDLISEYIVIEYVDRMYRLRANTKQKRAQLKLESLLIKLKNRLGQLGYKDRVEQIDKTE